MDAHIYTEQEIFGVNVETPFTLNDTTKFCEINCKTGFWSNINSSYNKADDGNDQRCTSNICKNWDYENLKQNDEDKYNICSECWGINEINDYNNWAAKSHFTEQEIAFVDVN